MDRYALIGAGGTGTQILPPLITYLPSYHTDGEWQLGVIDGDVVEPKNLLRQLFEPNTVQENKARASIIRYPHLHRNLVAIPEYLGVDNIERYIVEGTIVLIAADNFPVRALIEKHALSLDNIVVINGGNETHTGSCQIFIREGGQNITPPISFLHPEILEPGRDRSVMSCAEIAELPGGEQLIVANMASAMNMLTALIKYHRKEVLWTELQFDLLSGETYARDNRDLRGWNVTT